jgi:hypothetical protein
MKTNWKVVTTHKKGEIWITNKDTRAPLIWGVTRDTTEPLNVPLGSEVYGIPKDILSLYLDTVIRPALDETSWNLGHMLEILELYLQNPEETGSLLAVLYGRVHLASQTHQLNARLADLFIHYMRQLPLVTKMPEKFILAGWCYQLTNAFFVSVRDYNTALTWTNKNLGMLNDTFIEGVKLLKQFAPALLGPLQIAPFTQQLDFFLVNIQNLRRL